MCFPDNLPHSKHIGTKVAVLAVCASGADGRRARKYLALNHGVHGRKSGTGFGEEVSVMANRNVTSSVMMKMKIEAGRDRPRIFKDLHKQPSGV